MTRDQILRGLGLPIALILIGSAGIAANAVAADPDAPLTTAQPGAPSPTAPDASTTAEKIKRWVGDADDDGGALDLGPGGPPARRVHGAVDAWVGTHGERGFAAQAVVPIGSSSTLGLAVSTGRGPGVFGPYGYGPYAPYAYGAFAAPVIAPGLAPRPRCRPAAGPGFGPDPAAQAPPDCSDCCAAPAP